MKPLTASETRKDERMDFEKTAEDLRKEIERIIMTQDGDGVIRVEKACEKALRAAATVPPNKVRVGVEDKLNPEALRPLYEAAQNLIHHFECGRDECLTLKEIRVQFADAIALAESAAQAARERGGEG